MGYGLSFLFSPEKMLEFDGVVKMKNPPQVSIACYFWLCSMPVFAQSGASLSDEARLDFLRSAIAGTPYSALVIHSKVEITPLSLRRANAKKSLDDHEGEERHTYHARVLETFKGTAYATIRYEMIVEKNESAKLDSKPQLLTLCKGPRGFYWPGTGAGFPGEVALIEAARLAAKQPLKRAKVPESQCDEAR
jgi:hypothetical protein